MKAIISVYDKNGLEQLWETLESINCQIFSSVGTLSLLKIVDSIKI